MPRAHTLGFLVYVRPLCSFPPDRVSITLACVCSCVTGGKQVESIEAPISIFTRSHTHGYDGESSGRSSPVDLDKTRLLSQHKKQEDGFRSYAQNLPNRRAHGTTRIS